MRLKKINQKGYNLVELAIAVVILSVMASAVITARSFMAKQTVRNTDKAYATQKAIQMFEELKALVNGNEQLGVAVLDNYSDGAKFNNVLTTDKNVDVGLLAVPAPNPGDPVSGNRLTNGYWRYLRQVQVNRVANDAYTRQVVIKVWLNASGTNPGLPGELLATVGGELRTITSLFPPTQVLDVYVLSVNNLQAWWDVLPGLNSTMQGVINDIGGSYGSGRNPGLQIRQHFITRSTYGRDSQYLPYINQASGTDQIQFPWVYLYPGLAPQDAPANGCGCESLFYDTSNGGIMQCGNFNTDTGPDMVNASQFAACPSYAVADQFNNGMRYPDELAMYQAVSQAAVASKVPVPEISERMLIEGMNSSPVSYANAIIFNLHGEVLPLPPIRNYSDAAKDPANSSGSGGPNMRIVTHPELLYYPASSGTKANINLRVYGYYDGLDDVTQLDSKYPDPKYLNTATIYLPDLPLANFTSIGVSAIYGSSTYGYGVTNLAQSTTLSAAQGQMSWTAAATLTGTLITLYNTPLRCPQYVPGGTPTPTASKNSGLSAANRLYGLEYIPSSPDITAGPIGNGNAFNFTSQPLTYTGSGAGQPKNTARWIINLNNVPPAPAASGYYTIETRIGNLQVAGGVAVTNTFPNLSRTYVWVGNNNLPPITEQYQFLGDPRHEPYLDTKVGGPIGGSAQIGANSYNWWFKNLNSPTDGYSGFGKAGPVSGWTGQNIEADIPRYNQVIRQGLLNSTSIWCTLNGWSFYYYGLGGEFGFDHAPYTNSITFLSDTPWKTTKTDAVTRVSEIRPVGGAVINDTKYIACTANSGTTQQWFAKSWLGELYPDSMYTVWAANGNLPDLDMPATFSAPATWNFYRADAGAIATGGNSLWGINGNVIDHMPQGNGCSSFFNGYPAGGSTGHNFQHQGSGNNGTASSLATTCFGIFQYSMPSIVSLNRPWHLDDNSNPPEWGIAPYNTTGATGLRTMLSIPAYANNSTPTRYYYNTDQNGGVASGWYGAAVVQVNDTASTKQAYVVETGTSPSANVGASDLAKTMMVLSLRTFLDGGQIAGTGAVGHITQLPLIKIYPVQVNAGVTTINPVPQFSNPSTIPFWIAGPLTDVTGTIPLANVWFRFPGLTPPANYYTEEYSPVPNGNQPLASSTYAESTTLIYNLKYSPDTGKHWYFMQSSAPATLGVMDTIPLNSPITDIAPVSIVQYNWDVSNPATYPQGDYWITAEAYRTASSLHYSYHTMEITINR